MDMKKYISTVLISVFFIAILLFWVFMEFSLVSHPDFASIVKSYGDPSPEMLYGMCVGLRPFLALCFSLSISALLEPFIQKYWPKRKK